LEQQLKEKQLLCYYRRTIELPQNRAASGTCGDPIFITTDTRRKAKAKKISRVATELP
jgi:hypothetical protein